MSEKERDDKKRCLETYANIKTKRQMEQLRTRIENNGRNPVCVQGVTILEKETNEIFNDFYGNKTNTKI